MPTSGSFDDGHLIGLIYAAAADQSAWQEVFQQMRAIFSGHTAVYERFDCAPDAHQLLVSDLDPSFVTAYNAHYNARNGWATSPLNQHGSIVVSERIIEPAELERTEFYGEWLRPQKLKHAATSPLMRKRARSLNLGLVRDSKHGEYQREEVRYLERLLPHFQRAVEIAERLEAASLTRQASLDAISASGACVILVDERRRIMFASEAAESLLAGAGPFSAAGGQLHAVLRREDDRLAAAARRAAGASGAACGDIFTLHCPADTAFTIAISPAPAIGIGFFHHGPLAMVLVGRPRVHLRSVPRRSAGSSAYRGPRRGLRQRCARVRR